MVAERLGSGAPAAQSAPASFEPGGEHPVPGSWFVDLTEGSGLGSRVVLRRGCAERVWGCTCCRAAPSVGVSSSTSKSQSGLTQPRRMVGGSRRIVLPGRLGLGEVVVSW